ncbi:Hypothetical predicted protein [Octopus vulgaris]|uniref:Reverse transcriptase domain-containing protein n=1 Tax=Octopus vulgaris TaxID=6645 RepID=A0AA36AQN6_OCTVU|nr:Hypothetical predicted protein [Octopus vulgaris]
MVTRGLPFVYAYIDDILVASNSDEEHNQHLHLLFERLRKYGVVINPKPYLKKDYVMSGFEPNTLIK